MNYKPSTFNRTFLLVPVLSLLLCTLTLVSFAKPGHPKKQPAADKKWVGTWGTARQLVEPQNNPPAPGLTNNTLRQVVCVSIGGKNIRLKFNNEFSKMPVTIKSVQIAASKGGSLIDAATSKALTFNGKADVTMDAGGEVFSDPISFDLKPREEVAITIAFGETSPSVTGHPGSRTTSFILAGDHNTADADFTGAVPAEHWYAINGIEVEANKNNASVVVLGDSITDGRGSGTNKQNRWPDILEMALLKNKKTENIGVLNMGIGGNTVLRGGLGPTASLRFQHDVLDQNGVKWLIIFEGTNDIGGKRDSTTASNTAQGLIEAFQKMITDAHAKGIKVYGATITPFKLNNYYSKFSEAARNTVNNWIRNSGKFDAVIDFDKTTQDPANPDTIAPEFVPGLNANDHLHLNELGYKKMGESIDLSLFK